MARFWITTTQRIAGKPVRFVFETDAADTIEQFAARGTAQAFILGARLDIRPGKPTERKPMALALSQIISIEPSTPRAFEMFEQASSFQVGHFPDLEVIAPQAPAEARP